MELEHVPDLLLHFTLYHHGGWFCFKGQPARHCPFAFSYVDTGVHTFLLLHRSSPFCHIVVTGMTLPYDNHHSSLLSGDARV